VRRVKRLIAFTPAEREFLDKSCSIMGRSRLASSHATDLSPGVQNPQATLTIRF